MYIVAGKHVWGRGKTEAEALKKASVYGRKLKTYLVYWVDDDEAVVDLYGFIVHHGKEKAKLVRKVRNGKEVRDDASK